MSNLPVIATPRRTSPPSLAVERPANAGLPARPFEPIPLEGSTASDLGEFVRRNYRVVFATTLAGLALAFAIAKSQTPMYRATASIEIQDLNENFLNLKDVSPLASAPQNPFSSDLQTQLRLLQSRSLVERVLSQLPAERKQPARGWRTLWARVRGNRPAAALTHEEVVDGAIRNMDVRETRQARIVDLSYESEDPQYAAAFVNRLAQQYMDQSVESRIEISRGTTVWLSRQLEDLRGQLEASEKKLQKYAHDSGFLVTAGDHRPAEDQLRQIQENLAKAQENRIVRQARLETAANSPAESMEAPVGSALREYNTKLTDLRRQRADLLTVYTPDFDGVKRLDGQIHALEAAVRTESATILTGIQSDYNDALRREKLLENSYVQQVARVSEQGESAIQYGILKREADTNRELYNTMLQRAAEARVASALHASNARMVDLGRPPRLPFSPNTMLNLMWGGTAGLLIGLVFGVCRESYDRSIRKPGDLGMHLRVPELGVVPKMTTLSSGWDAPRLRSLGTKVPDASVEIALATWLRCKSPVADSFRSIVTSIVFSNELGRTPQVIAITSAQPQEGKTTVATNIAAALAHVNRKVLLFDGNLRAPRLHNIFDQVDNYGFADLLTMPGENSYLLSYITRPTGLPNVWLATPGPHESGALDLLYSRGMAALLARAREEFDLILIDTPAMIDLPDARILGSMSDAVVLVVKSGATDRQAAKAATSRLQQDGIPVLGTVLN
ncbi:MAG: polysaccharide biosynthesis tyrosine autokinase, partial [Acidobacteriia bacterium]|nr:polysaccharide biosynthesis tyrosine autokinase [Terriglobia bacterium]